MAATAQTAMQAVAAAQKASTQAAAAEAAEAEAMTAELDLMDSPACARLHVQRAIAAGAVAAAIVAGAAAGVCQSVAEDTEIVARKVDREHEVVTGKKQRGWR
eukprot:2412450-Prymnesium_polylepis.1